MIVYMRGEFIWGLVTYLLSLFQASSLLSLSFSLLPAYADQKLKEKIEVAELLMRKMSQFQDQPSTDHHLQEQEQEAQGNIHDPELIQEKGGDKHVDDTVTSQDPGRPSLGELSAVEENEGFRTPTSTKQKIPAITECPPAPRKPTATRAIPMKRRISKVPRRLQFEEFEVLIPPKILASLLSRLMKLSKDKTIHARKANGFVE